MKKSIITILAVVLCLSCLFAFAACTQNLKYGKKFYSVSAQADILTELNAGTADIGVMDSVMAGYYMNNSSYASSLQIIEDFSFEEEFYGIAARKGSGIINAINKAMVELSIDGTVAEIATNYGLNDVICIDNTKTYTVDTDNEDYKALMQKGEIVVGYTLFAPIAYEDENKALIGFDIDFAKAVFANLGLSVKFQEIFWETKEVELNAKNIDIIWNGLTITDERKESMEISAPYMENQQVAVIRKADIAKYTKDTDTWAEARMTAESGSAGESCIVVKKK